MKRQKLTIAVEKDDVVSAVLTVPEKTHSSIGVIVAHGAGNDMEHPLIQAFADGMASAGWPAMRFNFPYKEKGRKAPDGQKKLEDTWAAAFEFFQANTGLGEKHIILAGKSMGGRVASQMLAEKKLRAAGLIFLGYPLHPAGEKSKIRDAHLYAIDVPMLFFAGTRDPLCDLSLLRGVLKKLRSPWHLEIIEGGDHSFKVSEPLKKEASDIHARIEKTAVQWLNNTFA